MSIFLKKFFLLLLVIIFLPSCTILQAIKLVNSGKVVPNNITKSVIPFELKGHPIFIKVRLNNSENEYKFMFDTGALTIISQQVAKELELQSEIEFEMHGVGGKTETVNLVQLENVIVGNSEVKNIAAVVVDLAEKTGSDIGGIIGSNFLKFFQVTIDYQTNEIILVQDAQPIAAKNGDIQISFETDMKNGFAPIIDCVINNEIKCTGIIDTGTPEIAGVPVSLMKKMDSFLYDNVLTAAGGMRNGINGTADESYMLRLNTLEIDSLKLTNIPAMSHSAKDEHILLGNGFLSIFLVTIDYPAKIIVLHPNNTSFETNVFSYGLNVVKKNNKTIVSGIWDKSPASKVGLEVGDEIVKVNSKDTHALSIFELMTLFLDKKVNSIDIAFIHDNRKNNVKLHKKMLLPPIKK